MKMYLKKILMSAVALGLAALASSDVLSAQERAAVKRTFVSSSGQVLPYRTIWPDNFDPSKSYPLLLFLHGAGERGDDNEAQLTHGRGLLLESGQLRDVIVIAPQCPAEGYWVDIVRPTTYEECMNRTFPSDADITPSLAAVKELADAIISLGFVDMDRVYGTGLSMGAMGTLDLMCRFPDFFTAIEPVCGAVELSRLEAYNGKTAVRLFHGTKDETVPVHFSRDAYKVLSAKKGMTVEYVEYPECRHDSWTTAFASEGFLNWMLSKTKNQ